MTTYSIINNAAKRIALLTFLSLPLLCQCAPAEEIFFKKYSVQCSFIDSIRNVMNRADYQGAILNITMLESRAKQKGDEQFFTALRILRYRFILAAGKSGNTFEQNVLEILKQTENNQWNFLKADALELIADYWRENKNFAKAFEYYISAYNVYSVFPAEDFPNKSNYIYQYGGIYYHFTDYETAKQLFLEIWKTIPYEKINNFFPVVNNIALCYSFLQQYDSSAYFFRTGLNLAQQKKSNVWVGIFSGNIANIFYLKGNYDDAIPLLEKDIELSMIAGEKINAAYSMSRLGDIYLRKGESKKGLELELSAYEIIKERNKQKDYSVVKTVYPAVAKAYAANGNMTMAYAFLDTGAVAKDSIVQKRNILYLSGAQHKIEAAKHLAQLQKKEAELSRSKLIRNVYISGLLLVVVLLFFVYRNYSNQRKANRKLKEAQDQLVRSEKMAAFGAIASHVAHEIQNPLNFVNNFSEISEELVQEIITTTSADARTETGALLKDNLTRIVHHGKRVAEIVKQLQQHSRAGSAHVLFNEKKSETE